MKVSTAAAEAAAEGQRSGKGFGLVWGSCEGVCGPRHSPGVGLEQQLLWPGGAPALPAHPKTMQGLVCVFKGWCEGVAGAAAEFCIFTAAADKVALLLPT